MNPSHPPNLPKLLKSEIFDYVINILNRYDHHVRFKTRKTKDSFIAHVWKCYTDFNNKTLEEQIKYVEEELHWEDDEFTPTMCPNVRMELCLFYETWTHEWEIFNHDLPAKNHWLIRVGDGRNFRNSIQHQTWGMKETKSTKGFDYLVKPGDILWFIISGNNGKAIAFAEYVSHNGRTRTNEEFGWEPATNGNEEWNMEVNYANLKTIETDNHYTRIKGNSVNVRIYDENNRNVNVNLPGIYEAYLDA